MTPADVVKEVDEAIELAKQRANPKHTPFGGYRRQAPPVSSERVRAWISVEPIRQSPKWPAFISRVFATTERGGYMMIPVPELESIRDAMSPIEGKKGAVTNG